MNKSESILLFNKGASAWNAYREDTLNNNPDLSDVNFESELHDYKSLYDLPTFYDYNLSNMNLNRIIARNSSFINCDFSGSHISGSDLCFSHFMHCDFSNASMRVSRMGSAEFNDCEFSGANMSYCSAEDTSFVGSRFVKTRLNHMSLVKSDFSNTIIDNSRVYGISAWDLTLEGSQQNNIYIEEEGVRITVPSIELAQFISLLLNNSKVRDFIDTITSKMVLILGRFSNDRKPILDKIKKEIQRRDYLPVIFDFDGPNNRNLTETIVTLASLSKFVIADISSPKSIPHELQSIIQQFPSLPIQPLITQGQREYGMFEHFENYPWVLEKIIYSENEISKTVDHITSNCENYLRNI